MAEGLDINKLLTILTICQILFRRFYSSKSDGDQSTMFSDRTLINRRNVTNDPHVNYRADRDFFTIVVKSRVIAASMKVLGMKDKTCQPANYALPADLVDMPKLQKLECLHKAAAMVVDLFVVDELWVNRLIAQVCFQYFKD